jgi:hypothetical protein
LVFHVQNWGCTKIQETGILKIQNIAQLVFQTTKLIGFGEFHFGLVF